MTGTGPREYTAWLRINPVPGEVFVETGEASAEDRRELCWSPTDGERALMLSATADEMARVRALNTEEAVDRYAAQAAESARAALAAAGVDTSPLRLPDAWRGMPDPEPLDPEGPPLRSRNPIYFIAFVLLAALVCIVLPLVLTHGR